VREREFNTHRTRDPLSVARRSDTIRETMGSPLRRPHALTDDHREAAAGTAEFDFGVFALDGSDDDSYAPAVKAKGSRASELFALAKGVMFADRYRLGERIARGGMGSVWAANDERLGRDVAVKFMSPELVDDAEYRERFEQEAKAAAKLRSQHIVSIFEHGLFDGVPFIVLERLVGEDLHARLRRVERVPLDACDRILDHASKALRAAHDAGIVHRDIKPQNLFLARGSEGDDDEEVVKLLDFGVAKHAGTHAMRTKTGMVVGSPHFMSPEQVRGSREIGPTSDLFSLAAVLFRCVTGKRPYDGDLPQVMLKITGQPPPKVTELAPDLPVALDGFFQKGLATDPKARFQTASEMSRAFREIVDLAPARREISGSRPLRRETTLRFAKPEGSVEPAAVDEITTPEGAVTGRGPVSDAPTRMVPAEQAMGFTEGATMTGVDPSPWLAPAPAVEQPVTRGPLVSAWGDPMTDRRAARASLIGLVAIVALLVVLGLVAVLARF
jgi:serine/threonine protein kinase